MILDAGTVTKLADALTRVEAVAHQAGWNRPPVLSCVFAHYSPQAIAIEVEPLPVEPKAWYLPDPRTPGEALPPAVILASLAGFFATTGQARFAAWLGRDRRRFLGIAFTCEAHRTILPGQASGGLDAPPDEVRLVTALDVDERLYQVTRARGSGQPSVVVLEPAPPTHRETAIGEAMFNLLDTARDLQHHRRNGAHP